MVDDDPDVLVLVRILLESEGFKVSTVESGEKALELLGSDSFDLLVLDVVMPGLSGLDVLRRIRARREYSGLPVLVFTALGREVDLMLEPENKADAYLRKPFTKAQMVETVKSLLG